MTADRLQAAFWIGLGIALAWLLTLLSPILAPFLLAAILAYICNPLVTRIAGRGLPRVAAVLLMMALLGGLLTIFLLSLLPLFREETQQLLERLPDLLNLLNEDLAPWLYQHFGVHIKIRLAPADLRQLLTEHWDSVQSLLGKLALSAADGGQMLLQIASTLLLAPIALFYLLRDWPTLLQHAERLLPRHRAPQIVAMAQEVDAVLAQFLRGQLLVMLLLAVYYCAALALADIDYALPLGLLTGLLVFIPYLGFASGFVLALLVALLQLNGWGPVIAVLAVYGIGQIVESFLFTPLLVGERIGLHPLAVIFALLAFGQLFGFFGVLLALPASAALLVGVRRLHAAYLGSRFYTGEP
ncbi:MAG: AI-2E family transporter [Rhodocyclaceae bacterium]|nr:AI-2E family transporter [Rhodocyclaceae bacterium]